MGVYNSTKFSEVYKAIISNRDNIPQVESYFNLRTVDARSFAVQGRRRSKASQRNGTL
jgi:hypothetical protein